MKMYVAGEWTNGSEAVQITNPYSGELIDETPDADDADVERALSAAVSGAKAMASLTGFERSEILNRAADLLDARVEEFARLVSSEQGKPIFESRTEASRCAGILRLSAFEGTQARGESLPIDSAPNAANKIGFTLRVPCGVVVAITPFNYPMLLVMHKVGPALAAGNAVILKPATQTPLAALRMTEIFVEAGLPELGIQCITGSGARVGGALCRDERVRKITFTGSAAVGREITRVAGIKRLSLELGSTAPLVVLGDADLEQVGDAVAMSGFFNAGQVCTSTQRVIAEQSVYEELLSVAAERAGSITIGDPLDEQSRLSALTSVREAERVESWIEDAREAGARVVAGGGRDGGVLQPTIVADVKPEMQVWRDELFGPAVAMSAVADIDAAIELVNSSPYGLVSGIFTQDIGKAMRFAKEAQTGNVMINWGSLWRGDLIPFGGLKDSGIGKEGPRYAVQEMTEEKTVVVHNV